ncbi:MAG: ABC transporter ATP-binding protein [Firmicutes bacterium]|nr:ABC transporter ATP-binding protein [Bacillota bacterium]
MNEIALSVRNLTIEFPSESGRIRAVDQVNLNLERGKIMGLIGESGCGKSTVAFALLNSVPSPGIIVEGTIEYTGYGNLLKMTPEEQRLFRWQHVSVVFQASQNTLNPLKRIEDQIRELAQAHRIRDVRVLLERARSLCESLRLDTRRVLNSYPHQLSGGMKQRVGIMLALLLQPEIVLFDEPTTALDSLSQESVLQIIREIHQKDGLTGIFITHDLGIVSEIADTVAVMYAGRIVEISPTARVFSGPLHPYSQALLDALPRLTGDPRAARGLPGSPPKVVGNVSACLFRDRCPRRMPVCDLAAPELKRVDESSMAACFLYSESEEANVHVKMH